MSNLYNILLIEDDTSDVKLLQAQLNKLDFQLNVEIISKIGQLSDIISSNTPDIIISDVNVSGFNVESILDLIQDKNPHLPFILVTKLEGEQEAIDAMLKGATDYVTKDHPARLRAVIKRELARAQMLKKKNRLLNRAYQLAKIGSWELDLVNSTLYWSPAVKKLYEVDETYEPDLESAIKFYKEGEDRETIRKVLQETRESGKSFEEELRIITAKGSERWVRVIGEAEFKEGNCIRIYGSTQNIDKRKKVEESLKLSEHRFKSLVQGGSDIIAILDSKGNYINVIPTLGRDSLLGMTADDLIGKNVLDYIHKDDRNRYWDVFSSLSEQEQKKVEPFRFQDIEGNWHWIETTITNMLDNSVIGGFVTNSKDVTERIELLKTQEQFSETIENIFRFVPEGLMVFTDKINLFKKNKAMEDVVQKYAPKLGYSKKELMNELIKKVKENIRTNGKSKIKISRKNSSKFQ